jgi:hypothetical protein
MGMSSHTFVEDVLLGKQYNNNSLNDLRHRGSRAMMSTGSSVCWPNSGLNLTKGDKKCASTDRRREQ